MSYGKKMKSIALSTSALCLIAGLAQADQVFLDDVIIVGSLCVGLDCVNGESFGFDTLRLKENNLRIRAQDTSSSASFPSNDWQITFNDSSNGGANKFSIDDIDSGRTPFTIEASSPSNSLYVDNGGRIGFGTANPVVEAHIVDGDSPTLRLEQDGSSGFTPQTWDVAGNETNFFVRDVTNGSKLSFRIRPNAPTDSLYVAADGDVGLGTSSPDARLDVTVPSGDVTAAIFQGAGTKVIDLKSTDNGAVQYRLQSNSPNRRIVALTTAATPVIESQIILANNSILFAGSNDVGPNLWATIDSSGITTNGPTCNPGPCDRTFDAEHFDVPSIEEHASFMWDNSYLWGVGPTSPDTPFNVTEKTAGILHELEVAHIYIDQMNQRLSMLETHIAAN